MNELSVDDIVKMNPDDIIGKDNEEILRLIRKSVTGGVKDNLEATRDLCISTLNYKLSKTTETLSIRIWWLNIILIFLTLVIIVIPFIPFLKSH